MNIAIIAKRIDPNMGYLEYYLPKELAKLCHKVFVFTYWRSKKIQRTRLEGFEVIKLPYITFKYGDYIPSLKALIHVIKFMKILSLDIVHCLPLFSPLSLFFISLRRVFNYKVVGSITTQEFIVNTLFKKILFYVLCLITKYYIKNRSEVMFSKTYGLLKWFQQLFNIPRQKSLIIPLGADSELFKFDARASLLVRSSLGLSDDDIVIAYSGKIIPEKRLDLLIKALAPIMQHNRKVKLLIIGAGEKAISEFYDKYYVPSYKKYMEDLKSLISSFEISGNIIFYPWVHRLRLPELYSAIDIAVWPGLSSISIVEAASTSLPVIIEKACVEEYAIEDGNGFAFERGNVLQLRKYLELLIYNEDLRKEMGRKSRNLIERKLNWKTITKTYLDAYTHALQTS